MNTEGICAYTQAKYLGRLGYSFRALLIAATLTADETERKQLAASWPDLVAETLQREDAPHGLLDRFEVGFVEGYRGIVITPEIVKSLPRGDV